VRTGVPVPCAVWPSDRAVSHLPVEDGSSPRQSELAGALSAISVHAVREAHALGAGACAAFAMDGAGSAVRETWPPAVLAAGSAADARGAAAGGVALRPLAH